MSMQEQLLEAIEVIRPALQADGGDMNFVSVEVPRRIVGVGRGGKFNRIKSYAEWTLEPVAGGGTRVQLVYETDPPLVTDRLMEAVSGRRRWYKRSATKALKRMRRILEEGRGRGQRVTVAGL